MKSICTLILLRLAIVLLILSTGSVHGQPPPNSVYKEHIFLHTNTDFLLTGETLFFKVYCVDSWSNVASELSRLAYVELIDANMTPALRSKVPMTHGEGWGEFFLPSTLPTGNYTLVAYTKWMRNFRRVDFYRREITIINPFNKGFAEATRRPRNIKIGFYPEGGTLIAAVDNRIAFRATDENGQGVSFNGKIMSESGTTILEFAARQDGMGSFVLRPEAGIAYKAMIMDTLQQVSFVSLPSAATEGITFRILENEKEYRIGLEGHFKNRESGMIMRVLVRGDLIAEYPISFASHQATVVISKINLPFGTLALDVVNANHERVALHRIVNQHSKSESIAVEVDKKTYGFRERVSVTLVGASLNAHLSASVHSVEPIRRGTHSMEEAMTQDGPNQNGLILLDSGQEYGSVPSAVERSPTVRYLPDMRGDLVNGVVRDKNQAPLSHGQVYLSAPSLDYVFLAAETDSSGFFYFSSKNIKPVSELVLQLAPDKAQGYTITLDDGFLGDYKAFRPSPLVVDTTWRRAIEERNIFNQIENAFYAAKKDSVRQTTSPRRFYGRPSTVYKLDDYTRFPTMEDILREYVPEVIVRKRKEKFELRVINSQNGNAFLEAPLILLDGIPVFDTDVIMGVDPLKVKSMDVVRKRYFYSSSQSGGIISFATYDGDAKDLSMVGAVHKSFTGTQPSKVYFSPVYNRGKNDLSRIPDFRTQLIWIPDLVVNGNTRQKVEFFTGDSEGAFEIEIEGILANGERIHLRQRINVSAAR